MKELTADPPPVEVTLEQAVRTTEIRMLKLALQVSTGNRRRAAKLLGISLRTMFYKLRKYEL